MTIMNNALLLDRLTPSNLFILQEAYEGILPTRFEQNILQNSHSRTM